MASAASTPPVYRGAGAAAPSLCPHPSNPASARHVLSALGRAHTIHVLRGLATADAVHARRLEARRPRRIAPSLFSPHHPTISACSLLCSLPVERPVR